METKQESFGLQISQEEVWYLLKLLNIPAIPGCTVPDDNIQTRDVMSAMYGVAENSLIAQDVLRVVPDDTQPNGYQRQLDRKAVTLVGSGAIAEYTLSLTIRSESGIDVTSWIYFVSGLQIFHSIETGIVHRFIALINGDMILSAVASALQLRSNTQPVNNAIDIRLNYQALNTAQQEIRAGKLTNAVQTLKNAGLQQEVASYLARVLTDTFRTGYVDIMIQSEHTSTGFSFLETSNHYYMLMPADDDLCIRQAGLTDITRETVALIKDAQTLIN